jgi:tetratricopeptide (TPR) repeat protein
MLARVTNALPKRLSDAIAHSARPGKAEDARKAAEQLVKARDEGRVQQAHRAALKAKLAAPRSAWVREQLGLLAFALGDFHEAAQELLTYRRLSGDHRHDPAIAESYRLQGRPTRALDLIEEVRRSDVPNRVWVDVQIARARALADTDRRAAAEVLLREAARAASGPDRARVLEAIRDL